ncbi:MAG: 23S rRNA (pseudouridine(1915)-N(3))-methyltransferase RlmH [Clostridia bacterium]|nr:23S rRNA (pseudouridine(1915)-N(3))-methyltransferase RlmH [Clostridia bacterium]
MTIKICCVGKLKESFFIDGCLEYQKRLSRFCTVRICEVADEKAPESLSPAEEEQVKAREGERLLSVIDPKDTVIVLTIGGKRYTSEAFAAHLEALEDRGARTITFVIGGSLGLGKAVLNRANETLSLSDMTLPHRIARLVLLEQVFRAYKIRRKEAYHK